MNVLITGISGYVGSTIARELVRMVPGITVFGIDNLSRRGAANNVSRLKAAGIAFYHGDVRIPADLAGLPGADWVIDCAANPSVTAGLSSAPGSTSEQLVGHNLSGTLNILEYCRRHSAGLILLSTSRVYSLNDLCALPLKESPDRLDFSSAAPCGVRGVSAEGVAEDFPTTQPVSLYGATKRASEIMALEYGYAFNFPVRINRCGVIGGPGQFGKPDQGIFSYWVYAAALNRPLRYIGFGGSGRQVRDCVLAEDIADLALRQMRTPRDPETPAILNVGGGPEGSLSLRELTALCENFFKRTITVEPARDSRPFDIPWFVTDARAAARYWGWRPSSTARQIVQSLCEWTVDNRPTVEAFFE